MSTRKNSRGLTGHVHAWGAYIGCTRPLHLDGVRRRLRPQPPARAEPSNSSKLAQIQETTLGVHTLRNVWFSYPQQISRVQPASLRLLPAHGPPILPSPTSLRCRPRTGHEALHRTKSIREIYPPTPAARSPRSIIKDKEATKKRRPVFS